MEGECCRTIDKSRNVRIDDVTMFFHVLLDYIMTISSLRPSSSARYICLYGSQRLTEIETILSGGHQRISTLVTGN